MPETYEIYKVKDKSESYYSKKDIIFDLPMRLLIIGKSQASGKSNLVLNLILRPEYYGDDFKGENIYIVSPSIHTDNKIKKMIEVKNIPEENLMDDYDEEVLEKLYGILEEEYQEAVEENQKPVNKLVIFDDMSFSGALKAHQFGVVNKLYMNGRHINVSTIITAQKYSDISTGVRENATGVILFACSNKQLELVEADHNYLKSKRQFMDMFRDATNEKHTFFIINYTNDKHERYQNSTFDTIAQ